MLEECMPLDGALGSVGLWICRECVICVFVGKHEGRNSNLKTLMGFTRSSSGHGKRSEDVPSRLLVSLVSSFLTSQCLSALLFKGHAWVSLGAALLNVVLTT